MQIKGEEELIPRKKKKKKSQATEKFQNMVSTNDQIMNEGNYPIQTIKIKNIEENKQKLRDP